MRQPLPNSAFEIANTVSRHFDGPHGGGGDLNMASFNLRLPGARGTEFVLTVRRLTKSERDEEQVRLAEIRAELTAKGV